MTDKTNTVLAHLPTGMTPKYYLRTREAGAWSDELRPSHWAELTARLSGTQSRLKLITDRIFLPVILREVGENTLQVAPEAGSIRKVPTQLLNIYIQEARSLHSMSCTFQTEENEEWKLSGRVQHEYKGWETRVKVPRRPLGVHLPSWAEWPININKSARLCHALVEPEETLCKPRPGRLVPRPQWWLFSL